MPSNSENTPRQKNTDKPRSDLYRTRDFVSNFDVIAAEFAARSRSLSQKALVKANVAYGDRPREVLDLVFPKNSAADAPLHVFVHGGYWRSGEIADYRFVAEPIVAAGAIAAFVEYDLMPGQRLPVLVNQTRQAVHWLKRNASKLGADPARLSVSGHSAGAHLATYLAATAPAEPVGPILPTVKGMLLLSGIYDLADIPRSFLQHEAEMTDEEASGWSPLSSAHHDVPLRIIAHGADETAPFKEQAHLLVERLRSTSQTTELLAIRGLNHMNILLDLADPNTPLGTKLMDLI